MISFNIDKNYARKHYAKNSLIGMIFSGLIFLLSFFIIIVFISNTSLIIFSSTLLIISIIIGTISSVNYFGFKGYTKLIISDDKICIKKYESYGWDKPHSLDTINSYTYQIDELNNIEVKTKYIVITGNFVINKELGNGKLSLDMLNKQIIKISQIKIPRIFAEEDKIISSLNNMKKGGM